MDTIIKDFDGKVYFKKEEMPKEVFEWLINNGIIYCGGDVIDNPEYTVGYGKKFYNFKKP